MRELLIRNFQVCKFYVY